MILVTGATGNVGGELVRQLAEAGQPVRALTRGDAQGGFPPGVQVVPGDLNDPASLRPALHGATGVFLLPGYADMTGVLAEARQAGVAKVAQLSRARSRSPRRAASPSSAGSWAGPCGSRRSPTTRRGPR